MRSYSSAWWAVVFFLLLGCSTATQTPATAQQDGDEPNEEEVTLVTLSVPNMT